MSQNIVYKTAKTAKKAFMNIRKLLIDRRHDPEPILGSDYSCSFPSQYIIEPGNICNLKCPFCVNGMERKDSHPNRGFLGLNEFKVLLNKISPYARRIYFYNWGEPFLNKNIHSMVRLAVDRGIETYISSNLSLTELNYKAIIESGLTSLVVSIDGACPKIVLIFSANLTLSIDCTHCTRGSTFAVLFV